MPRICVSIVKMFKNSFDIACQDCQKLSFIKKLSRKSKTDSALPLVASEVHESRRAKEPPIETLSPPALMVALFLLRELSHDVEESKTKRDGIRP